MSALERPADADGEAVEVRGREEGRAAETAAPGALTAALMEQVVQTDTLWNAAARVRKNRGAPGPDGMRVEQLEDWLRVHEATLREALLAGRYVPQPVLRRSIPKPGGGERLLGIPAVVDRLVQQALLQVLQPRIDPSFSEHSYGFRPGRSALQAVQAAQRFIAEGRTVVVDVDLERFFDTVHHDVLMARLARRIEDKRVLRLIRAYLRAGIMLHGVWMNVGEGAPQGGPLSPLLANVLLDEVDKELEARGHAFVRYADDCNVYVRSLKAGERVLAALRKQYASLRLRINESKSAVGEVWGRKFLGYTFEREKDGVVVPGFAKQTVERLKERVR
jgi:RNA-directed DNA polymerase